MNVAVLTAWSLPARAALRGFWQWWTAELSGLIPRSWHDRMRGRIEARVVGRDIELEIIRPRNAPIKGVFHGATKSAESQTLVTVLRRERAKLPVWLIPPAQSVLSRTVSLPRTAVPAFAKLLTLEADRWTPYGAADIAAAWREVASDGGGKVDVELRFVPMTGVEQWKRQLADIELVPSLVILGSAPELRASLTVRGPKLSRTRRFAAVVLMLATAIALVADWGAAARERDALRRRIDAEQQEYVQQRDIEKRLGDILAASREQRRGGLARSRSSLLLALAGLVPETDWLSEIILRKDAATLRGYSVTPERLLKALGPIANNGDVALQGELALDAKLERQRFSVAFRVLEEDDK